ncbi:MAG: ATP-binding protein [Thermoanaerobaculia bacterium]
MSRRTTPARLPAGTDQPNHYWIPSTATTTGGPISLLIGPPAQVERYRSKISGPLLDRIDLHIEVPSISLEELDGNSGESTGPVASRIAAARTPQGTRFEEGFPTPYNSALSGHALQEACELTPSGRSLLESAFDKLGLSARSVHRVLRVARTIADLDGSPSVEPPHLAEAIQYRALDRRYQA